MLNLASGLNLPTALNESYDGKTDLREPVPARAGHMPPYLAGRRQETEQFRRLLNQDIVLENLVLTGLRGVGKTVLSDTLKPLAIQQGWLWVGTDLSESISISEDRMAPNGGPAPLRRLLY